MSYKYETQYNSPNFTTAADAPRVWGRAYKVTAIAIHWWGDPNTNPSYRGVINVLTSPSRGASAHFVATGTNRSVAQLINLSNASWATNSANPYTVSIECDPRCRPEDYDVVAELIANIRSVYGNIPLVPHRQFAATQCPGNYDLGRLDALANTKDGSGDWGVVVNKGPTGPSAQDLRKAMIERVFREQLLRDVDASGLGHYLTGYSSGLSEAQIVADIQAGSEYKMVHAPKPAPTPTPETPAEPTEPSPKPSEPESGTTEPDDTGRALQGLIRALKSFWKIVVKFWNS